MRSSSAARLTGARNFIPAPIRINFDLAVPKIKAYYEEALADFSMEDMAHILHYFLKLLDNMEKVDHAAGGEEVTADAEAAS